MGVRIALFGAHGRMGSSIRDACQSHREECEVVHCVDPLGATEVTVAPGAATFDVILDFSSDEGARKALATAQSHAKPIVIGTTGLSARTLEAAGEVARRSAVVLAPNTSLGVAVLRELTERAARILGADADADIVESHHTKKVDAPSGTAKLLADAVGKGRGKPLENQRIHAIRAGDIVGQHEVRFALAGESLTLSHAAGSRRLFAEGALRLAAWAARLPAGRYGVEDWLAWRCGE